MAKNTIFFNEKKKISEYNTFGDEVEKHICDALINNQELKRLDISFKIFLFLIILHISKKN